MQRDRIHALCVTRVAPSLVPVESSGESHTHGSTVGLGGSRRLFCLAEVCLTFQRLMVAGTIVTHFTKTQSILKLSLAGPCERGVLATSQEFNPMENGGVMIWKKTSIVLGFAPITCL